MKRNKQMQRIIIVGCGHLGSALANKLSHEGNKVTIIDMNPSLFGHLSDDFSGFRIEGDATQIAVLTEAGIKNTTAVIALTNDDNANLMVTQVARNVFQVPHVMARVYDPRRAMLFDKLGINTVNPTSITMEILLRNLANTVADGGSQ